MKAMRYKIALLSLLSLPAMLVVATAGSAAAAPQHSAASARPAAATSASSVTSSSLGTFKPTFAGTAATGCAGPPTCSLLTGPLNTPSTAATSQGAGAPAQAARTPWRRRISGIAISPRPNGA